MSPEVLAAFQRQADQITALTLILSNVMSVERLHREDGEDWLSNLHESTTKALLKPKKGPAAKSAVHIAEIVDDYFKRIESGARWLKRQRSTH
jgi:hypothetical protein